MAALIVGLISVGSASAQETAKYCNDGGANIVVYVDKTTPYDDVDKQQLIDGVSRLFESLGGGDRLVMRTIAESFTSSATLLDECVPYCPPGNIFTDLFGSCTEGVMLNDKKRLRGRVVAQLQSLLSNFVELPNSEIVRTIGLTLGAELRPAKRNRIYLFTDLIENSQYMPGKAFFSDKNDVLLQKVKADGLVPSLAGGTVEVFGVGRGGTADRRPLDQNLLTKLEDFWTRYFQAAGTSVRIEQSLGAVS